MGEETFGFTLTAGTVVKREGIVGQSAGLAELLEYDAVHAAAIVLVEECGHSLLIGIPCAALVVEHAHIDVLGLVGGNPYLVLGRHLHGEGLSLWCGSQFLSCLVEFSNHVRELLLAERTII